MLTGSFKISGNVMELNSAASEGGELYIINHNADAESAAITLQKKSESPANGDYLGMIAGVGRLNNLSAYEYGNIEFQSTDVTNKIGQMKFVVSDTPGRRRWR